MARTTAIFKQLSRKKMRKLTVSFAFWPLRGSRDCGKAYLSG
jgi:hypothetical protein